jgi:hypothetical protein
MVDIPFLLDKCEDCGSKWRANDRDASKRCLVCGGTNVTLARPAVLAGAGAVVLFIAIAGVFAATHSRGGTLATGAGSAAGQARPSYVAPIATSAPGSVPVPQPAKPGSPAAPASRGYGDAAATPGSNAKGDLPAMPTDVGVTAEQFPSMDCSAASSATARKICGSPALAKMDEELAVVYGVAWQSSGRKQALYAEQDLWQHNVLDACSDETCMTSAFKERTAQLAGSLGGPQ